MEVYVDSSCLTKMDSNYSNHHIILRHLEIRTIQLIQSLSLEKGSLDFEVVISKKMTATTMIFSLYLETKSELILNGITLKVKKLANYQLPKAP